MSADHSAGDREDGIMLGRLAVKYGLLTADQVRSALKAQKNLVAKGNRMPLGKLLVEMGLLSELQLEALLQIQRFLKQRREEKHFLDFAVSKGHLLPQEEKRALKRQLALFRSDRRVRPIDEILLKEGILSESSLETLRKEFALFKGEQKKAPEKAREEDAHKDATNLRAPSPFNLEELERIFQVQVSSDRLEATLTWNKRPPESLDPRHLEQFIANQGIREGLVDLDTVVTLLTTHRTPRGKVRVARGVPPKPGRDAVIRYHFETDPLQVGRIKEGGAIDFRDRGEIPQVTEGTLLAEKIPPQPGTPGTDVFGDPIPPPDPLDLPLRCGRGAVFSEDGRRVYAETPGRPMVTADGKISVHPHLEIPGDVDLKTGHVVFDGHVTVHGAVTPGFKVKAASLSAREIHQGEVDCEGHVEVTGGIIGAVVRSAGDVKVRHTTGSRIRAAGNVVVESSVVDCTIETSGSFHLATGSVLSSNITAFESIDAFHIGSEKSKACHLTVGKDLFFKEKIESLRQTMRRLKTRSERYRKAGSKLRKSLDSMELTIGTIVQKQDRLNAKLRQLQEMLDTAESESLKLLEEEKAALQQRMEAAERELDALFRTHEKIKSKIAGLGEKHRELQDRFQEHRGEYRALVQWMKARRVRSQVTVRGTLAAGTVINGPSSRWQVTEPISRSVIKEQTLRDPVTGKTQKKMVPMPLET